MEKRFFQVETENLFDITKAKGGWLCQTYAKLYNVQV